MHSQYIYSNLLSPRQRSNPLQLAIQIPKERGYVRHVSWVAATATGERGVHLSGSWGGEGKGKVCAVNEHKDFFHCITPGSAVTRRPPQKAGERGSGSALEDPHPGRIPARQPRGCTRSWALLSRAQRSPFGPT